MATVASINDLGNFAHNPRGNLWFNDDSTYGHKLLVKMGWSKGKGLGKKEDGIKENIKVKFRNTNSGLGFKDDSYANVMKTDYDSILKNLSAEYQQQKADNVCDEDVEYKNSKQKSRFVKCRIRYPKLYYGKDVSKYSKEDMKSIFICSFPSGENKEDKQGDPQLSHVKEIENEPNMYATRTSQLSISDYFNLKMKEKKGDKLKESKFNFKSKEAKIDFPCNETEDAVVIKQEKTESDCSNLENAVIAPNKKCKKRKKNSEKSRNDDNYSLLYFQNKMKQDASAPNSKLSELKNSMCERDFNEKMCQLPNTTNSQTFTSSRKRKRSHKKSNLDSGTDADTMSISPSEVSSDILPVPNKKKKKVDRNKHEESIETVQLLSITSESGVLSNKKLVNNVSISGLVEVVDENLSNNNNNFSKKNKKLKNKLCKLKKLKSCLKSKNNTYSVKNVSFNENISYQVIDSDKECNNSLSENPEKSQNNLSNSNHELENDSCSDLFETQGSSLNEKANNIKVNNESEAGALKTEECDSVPGLPSSDSSHYNAWVESQTLALKMKMYKHLLKSIKKHDKFKTTNLLSIKGYGNWGF